MTSSRPNKVSFSARSEEHSHCVGRVSCRFSHTIRATACSGRARVYFLGAMHFCIGGSPAVTLMVPFTDSMGAPTENFSRVVAAARFTLQRATGDIPFQRLPTLGGPDLFRGWYLGRLRDRALVCQQFEWRSELSHSMAVVSFVSAGRVAPTLASLTPGELRYAGGVGYRYALDIEQRAHLRLDLAYGAGFEFYFQFKEAF